MTSHGARVHLAGGDSVEGDLLVGADGVGSAIRRELHPLEPPPRSSHIVAVRGAVHGALEHLRGLDAIGYLGPGVEAMFIRASDTGMYWYYSMASELLPPDLRDARAVLACMTPQMDHTVRTITSATEDLRCDELFDRDPIPTWGRGPVTLVGDAAHPVLPHTGQGAAQAIVDAVTLGRMLNDVGHLDATLRAYEAERRAKTSALLTKGRHTARFMRTRHPLACTLRELFIRLIPVTTGARLYASISRKAGTDVRA
jgi:2-polyprenyl-6-methoxyphenol hydroxylase-like FAD-dependent oxidoreductase